MTIDGAEQRDADIERVVDERLMSSAMRWSGLSAESPFQPHAVMDAAAEPAAEDSAW